MMTRSLLTVAALAAFVAMSLTLPAREAAAQEVKIAYVDLQRALLEVEDGKTAKKKLKRMFNKRQKTLDKEQEALKEFKERLEVELKSDLLSDDKKKEKMMEYQQRFYELQNLYMKLQKELAGAEAKETKKIFTRFREILKVIGQTKGYTIILEKTESSVLWARKDLDITDIVIQKYNAGGK
jgi:outer membrane protein